MRILVVIASYGTKNDTYLHQLINHYHSFPYALNIVVLSNQQKFLPPGVELVVGLPSRNPWSLPFAHSHLFAARKDSFDLFIYSEDDTPISLRGLEAFLRYTDQLPSNLIAGFLRYEAAPDGQRFISSAHAHFHWDVDSVLQTPAGTVARFTNEHSAAYVITRAQLGRALVSGRYLVAPHEGRYDLLCTAATDIYTQCGFTKVVSLSHFDDFLLHHLPNKYVGRMGVSVAHFKRMIEAMEAIAIGKHPKTCLPTVLRQGVYERWLPNYYEESCAEMLASVPKAAREVLMIGCGWGLTEQALLERGHRVVAIPLDSVVGALAADRGIDIRYTSSVGQWMAASDAKYDCIVINSILHLLEQPLPFIIEVSQSLRPNGLLIIRTPNFDGLSFIRNRLRRRQGFYGFKPFSRSGVRPSSLSQYRSWLRRCNLVVEKEVYFLQANLGVPSAVRAILPAALLSRELILSARVE